MDSSTSSENIAKIFNTCMQKQDLSPDRPEPLTAEAVLDTFFLYALLRDSRLRGYQLTSAHHGLVDRRFDQALHNRNVILAGTGQPLWSHACSGCAKVKEDSAGRLCTCRSCKCGDRLSPPLQTESLHVSLTVSQWGIPAAPSKGPTICRAGRPSIPRKTSTVQSMAAKSISAPFAIADSLARKALRLALESLIATKNSPSERAASPGSS